MSLIRKLNGKSLSKKYVVAHLFKNVVKRAKILKDLNLPNTTAYNVFKTADTIIAECKQGSNGDVVCFCFTSNKRLP